MQSPRKSASEISFKRQEHTRMMPSSTKSCESLYSVSASSSKGTASSVYRRKNSKMPGQYQPSFIPATTEVRQRVLSARRLRMKTYQNQLADAQQTIANLAHENRMLRTLHKRQDSALAKYESTNAELPKLLHSHAEELRVWQAKYRALQTQNKELEHKLKQKEAVILSLSDQNKYYAQLNKDKNLDERQRLSDKLHQLEQRILEKDNDMKLFARKVQLETKNYKKQLAMEQSRHKDLLLKLEKTRLELSGYRKLDDLNIEDKYGDLSIPMRRKLNYKIGGKETKLESLQEPEKSSAAGKSDSSAAEEDGDVENETPTDFIASDRSNKCKMSGSKQSLTVRKKTSSSTIIISTSAQNKNDSLQRRVDRGDGDANSMQETRQSKSFKVSAGQDKLGNQENHKKQYHLQKDNESIGNVSSKAHYVEENGDFESDNEVAANNEMNYEDEMEGEEFEEEAEAEEIENDEVGEDDDEEDASVSDMMVQKTRNSARMKEDISSIRKQISNDYKEREAFLDTFCRQATNTSLRDELPKRNSISMGHNLPGNRKHKLLAALKAIDDNKSED